jgi:hypothetical protein
MTLWLRLSGWVCFLLGAGVFFVAGGFSEPKNPIPWMGVFTALLGMILTSSANLAAHFERMRRLKEQAARNRELRPPPPPPPPPAKL